MNTKETIHLLVEQNLGLANHLALSKKLNLPKRVYFQEVQAAAYFGLVDAANRYQVDRGVSFTTYAYRRIKGAIEDYLRELGRSMMSLDKVLVN